MILTRVTIFTTFSSKRVEDLWQTFKTAAIVLHVVSEAVNFDEAFAALRNVLHLQIDFKSNQLD